MQLSIYPDQSYKVNKNTKLNYVYTFNDEHLKNINALNISLTNDKGVQELKDNNLKDDKKCVGYYWDSNYSYPFENPFSLPGLRYSRNEIDEDDSNLRFSKNDPPKKAKSPEQIAYELSNSLTNNYQNFSKTLFKYIDAKGYTDVDCYKKANIDRRLFSRLRNTNDYQPRKQTVIAFCVALELDINESEELLKEAGYTLSNSLTFDIIVRYFIERKDEFIKAKQYTVYDINAYLQYFNAPLLGTQFRY